MNTAQSDSTHKLRLIRGELEDLLLARDKLIREARNNGMTFREIGNAVGLSHTGVEKIIKGSRVQDSG